jgi:penicillin amidase
VNNTSFPGKEPDMLNNALKWELHRPSNEMHTFIKLGRATNYEQYKDAIRNYGCPLQNFTFACKDNTIAINHQGSMAEKAQGDGTFIMDGTSSSHIYTKYIPQDSLPQLLNPACNYVLSANQHPTYSNYPYYYHGYYAETRANRIKQLLEKDSTFDAKSMEAIQLDDVNTFALDALPILKSRVHNERLNPQQQQIYDTLLNWKGTYTENDAYAKMYEMWWENIEDYTWDEFDSYQFYKRPPDDYVLLDLIKNDPASHYFDKQGTPKKEEAGDIITNSLITAITDFKDREKNQDMHWSAQHKVNILHLTNMIAFSKMQLPAAGHPTAINATSRSWGPSWRMIVELGDRPKAYGVYPGGQSGNIGSDNYDNFIDDWNKGNYYLLNFYMSADEAKANTANTLILK